MSERSEPKPLRTGHPKVQVTDYAALKAYGFSPAKAAKVVIDANRGDKHARRFVDLAREHAMQAT